MLLHLLLSAAAATASPPVTPADIIARIDTASYSGEATFSVTMPQLPDDVVYSLAIAQTPTPADTICPVAYLIDWTITQRPGMTGPTAADKGFYAYFDGNHYSLMAERLRERHMATDPDAFTRPRRGGVAVTSQFADLVPALMGLRLREMLDDPRYTLTAIADTTVNGEHAVALLATMTAGGSVASEAEYLFYPGERLRPRRVVLENNTGSIGEQTVTAQFAQGSATPAAPLDEESLIALYPDEFARFRTSTYRLETLPGRYLPAIAAPTLGGGRYARNASQPLEAPTAIVLLEARSQFTPEVVSAVRDAARQLPWPVAVIWAFTDTNPDDVAAVMGDSTPGADETVLCSARSVARDCGAASTLPAIVFAGRDGIVAGYIAGFNNSLASDVVKKMMGLRP